MPPASATRSRTLDMGPPGFGNGRGERAAGRLPPASPADPFPLHPEVETGPPPRGRRSARSGASVPAMWPRPSRLDVAFACVSAVLTLLVVFFPDQVAATDGELVGARWWAGPLVLIASAALLWRRSHPLFTIVGV